MVRKYICVTSGGSTQYLFGSLERGWENQMNRFYGVSVINGYDFHILKSHNGRVIKSICLVRVGEEGGGLYQVNPFKNTFQ